MNAQKVVITLPDKIYEWVKKKSQLTQRTVADEVAAVIISSVPEQEVIPLDIDQELSTLDLFSDNELIDAAQLTAPESKTDRIQELLEKQQLEGLTEVEKQETELLSHFFNRIMLVRAKAAVLLKERGYNLNETLSQ